MCREVRPEIKALICELCRMVAEVKPCVLTPSPEDAENLLILMGVRERVYRLEVEMRDKALRGGFTLCTFFSKDKSVLDEILARAPLDDRQLGRYLGYPSCCIDRYIRDGGFVEAHKRYKKQCRELGRDPFEIKLVEFKGEYYLTFSQVGGISHIPCSPSCKKSGELALAYERFCARIQCPLDKLKREPRPSAGEF